MENVFSSKKQDKLEEWIFALKFYLKEERLRDEPGCLGKYKSFTTGGISKQSTEGEQRNCYLMGWIC
jgi:hypothetical protein